MKKILRHLFTTATGLCQLAYFVGAVAAIVYFFPREKQSTYKFEENKPWQYGTIHAPYDFPIYKSDAHLQHEQDSILKTVRPYFNIDENTGIEQIDNFKREHQEMLQDAHTADAFHYIKYTLDYIYNKGIVATDIYDQLQSSEIPGIRIVNNNTIKRESKLSDFFTPRTAYEYIVNHASNEQHEMLYRCNLNNYLAENLAYDSLKSNSARHEALQRVPISQGMVQKGERIIANGEIVNHDRFLKLQSLESVKQRNNKRTEQQEMFIIVGQVLVVFCLFMFLFRHLAIFYPRIFNDRKTLGFIIIMITAITIMCYFLCGMFKTSGMYLVPIAILPITIVVFLPKSIALVVSIIAILLCSFSVPNPLEFILLQMAVSISAINNLKELERRSQLLRCVIFVFITYCLTYIGYTLIFEGWIKLDPQLFLYLSINCALLFFAYLLIYLIEKIFGFISTVTLVELSDINLKIFRKMSEDAPGTFQHSIQVSNLAADAANHIEAKAQLIRTGALYHDIGKIENPAYFTENQSGINPHNNHSYEESAQIIINHVKDGVKLAEKLGLPSMIIDFIRTHHGTSKTKYFYNSWVNEHPDEKVNEELFTYPGPNPTTKEHALLMMADAVEAASRSIKEYTEENIATLVNKIIDSQITDGLLNNSPLSFQDITKVKEAFIEKLKTMYHTRISYPELKK